MIFYCCEIDSTMFGHNKRLACHTELTCIVVIWSSMASIFIRDDLVSEDSGYLRKCRAILAS